MKPHLLRVGEGGYDGGDAAADELPQVQVCGRFGGRGAEDEVQCL